MELRLGGEGEEGNSRCGYATGLRRFTVSEATVLNLFQLYFYATMRNLNKLLAWEHARAIEDVLEQQEAALAVSDQFADPEAVKRRLFEKGRAIALVSRVRAEEDTAVAVASVLARAEFLRRIERLSPRRGGGARGG